MKHVLFSPLAEGDLHGILEYIARDRPAAGVKFVARLRQTCYMLAGNPGMGQRWPEFRSGEYRCFVVERYVIFYRQVSGGIEIARVVSGYRDLDAIS